MDVELRNPRYELIRKIGSGGIGVVYEALDRESQTRVALKTLQRASPRSIARFKREFRAVADVVHPNLVGLYELVAEPGSLFFTMELIDGVDFLRWVRVPPAIEPGAIADMETTFTAVAETEATVQSGSPNTGPRREVVDRGILDIHRLRVGMRQLAEGVAAIHQAGMLHRDLKTSNVMVGSDDRVVILDFGLVADIAEERRGGADDRPLEGTAPYMSPEQGARQALTPASDWYSVGVMLYLSLTGRLPFVGGRDDILMDKQRFEPPPPRELQPDAPPDLSALCSELLRREPERRPDGADVLRRLGSDRSPTSMRSASGMSSQSSFEILVGRDQELGVLDQSLVRVEQGEAVLVHVVGSSGVGKSRLVRAFVDELELRALVLRGRCYERESVPFKAVDSIIDELARHLASRPTIEVEGLMPRDAELLAKVFPVLKQVEAFTSHRRRRRNAAPDPTEIRRRVFNALRELLVRLADRQAIVIAIDDLQWGDVDSAALLSALVSGADPPSLLLLVCYRTVDRTENPFIRVFEQQTVDIGARVVRLPVGPLAPEDARQLARMHLGRTGEITAEVERIAAEAAGSPFFVEELARHARDHAGSVGDIRLDDVLRQRVQRLPNDAGNLLEAISVAARPIPQAVVMRAAGVDDPSVLSLLKAGSFARTRQVRGQRFVEAYHDRVRETAVALLEPEQLREVHLRLARALEGEPQPDPEALATHYYGAGDVRRAADFALTAAQHASDTLAFDRAAGLYRMALESDDLLDPHAARVALGTALANAGRGAEAAEVYLSAVHDGLSPAEKFWLRSQASSQLLASGHVDQGLAALERVLDEVGMKLSPSPARALAAIGWHRLLLAVGGLRFDETPEREVPASQLATIDATFAVAEGLGMVDVIRAAEFHNRSLRLALKAGEPRRVARALAAEAVFRSLAGVKVARSCDEIIARIDELADRLNDPATRGLAVGARGMASFNLARFGACYEATVEAETIFRTQCTGFNWEVATSQLFQGFALGIAGRVKEMIENYPRLVKDADERGDLYAATSLRACLGFYVPLTRDDPETALREVDDAMARWTSRGYHLQHANALNARIFIDLYRGDGHSALQRWDRDWKDLKRSLILRAQLMRALLGSARARAAVQVCVQDGPQPHLMRIIKREARSLRHEGARYCDGEALLLQGTWEKLRGNRKRAVELLRQAADICLDAELRLNGNAARRACGRLLGGDEGAELMASAEAYFRSQGLDNLDAVERTFAPGFLD